MVFRVDAPLLKLSPIDYNCIGDYLGMCFITFVYSFDASCDDIEDVDVDEVVVVVVVNVDVDVDDLLQFMFMVGQRFSDVLRCGSVLITLFQLWFCLLLVAGCC